MPKNKVSDLITDQEMAFARLVLSGTMTDRGAAETVGLNPDTAAYTKSKPRVRAYMLEHRTVMQQQFLDQAAEGRRRLDLRREQVLARLWEIAKLAPEMTRGSITGQVKALSMIVAMESLIPDRRPASSENKSDPPPSRPNLYGAAWLGRQQGETIDPQPDPPLAQEKDEPGLTGPETTPGSAAAAPPLGPAFGNSGFAFANRFISSETTPAALHASASVSTPDSRSPFSIRNNAPARRR